MDALILSCSTGGGHNNAGYAVKEELEHRGHNVTMLDPYTLVGKNVERAVSNGYIKIAQRTPRLFGLIYKLGDLYRLLPIHSPVYGVNKLMCNKMQEYLESHHYDVIIIPHIYPGEILTYMRNKGIEVPKTIFIATDYVCVPFTEEITCDYYITPTKALADDFTARGINREKLIHAGIPVKHAFSETMPRKDALKELGLDKNKRYLLLSGGSIGAGGMRKTIRALCRYLEKRPDYHLIIICGNNNKLKKELQSKYGKNPQITILGQTDKMSLYMKACDVFLSKPGGLSSTEAAVSGTPLIHISPIPGCEIKNMRFFEQSGMSICAAKSTDKLIDALEMLKDREFADQMRDNQRKHINPAAAQEICELAERIAQR